MSKSKCCNAEIIGKGGNQSQRKYYCSNCNKPTIPTKGAPPSPIKSKREPSKLVSQFAFEYITAHKLNGLKSGQAIIDFAFCFDSQ